MSYDQNPPANPRERELDQQAEQIARDQLMEKQPTKDALRRVMQITGEPPARAAGILRACNALENERRARGEARGLNKTLAEVLARSRPMLVLTPEVLAKLNRR